MIESIPVKSHGCYQPQSFKEHLFRLKAKACSWHLVDESLKKNDIDKLISQLNPKKHAYGSERGQKCSDSTFEHRFETSLI